MKRLKIPKEPIEVKHVHTTEIELVLRESPDAHRAQIGDSWMYWGWEKYTISNLFLAQGSEWRIRSICCVRIPEIRTQKYNERNHKNLNQLILIQAHDLLNRLIGSRYNQVELGMKDRIGKITIHREFQFQHASGSYFSGNQLDLEYSQNAQYFEIGEGFEPHFKLWRRVY